MSKYGFKIRTRGGMMVESLQVHARDREEAERKIKQIYHQSEIVECQAHVNCMNRQVAADGLSEAEQAIGLEDETPGEQTRKS